MLLSKFEYILFLYFLEILMRKALLIIAAFLLTSMSIFADNGNSAASYSHYYEEQPDVANCKAGYVTQAEKDKVIAEINAIRAVHHLKPVAYNEAFDKKSAESALIQAANDNLSHTPAQSAKCYSQDGYDGSERSNLYISWYMGSSPPATEVSIHNWMTDQFSERVGHRRWIIDPFLKHVAIGRADGASTVNQGYDNTAMALYCIDRDNEQNVSDWDYDFVAYPYQYYKPRWVYCQTQTNHNYHYMSFTYIADKSQGYLGNINVSFANATISMTDEDGKSITIEKELTNNEGYGTPNCLMWLPSELIQDKRYNVEIKGVEYGGTTKDFSYWYMVTENDYEIEPSIPILDFPEDKARNIVTDLSFSWNDDPNAEYYHLQVATDEAMTNLVIDEDAIEEAFYRASPGLDIETNYFWRVRAGNAAGWSDFSSIRSFETKEGEITDVVTLLSPANNATGVSLTTTIKWNQFPDAESYFLKVAPEEDVENYDDWYGISTSVSDTEYQVDEGELEIGQQYWWIVKAKTSGGETEWSEVWTFTIESGENMKVELLEPVNNAEQISVTPTLVWNEVSGADSYELQIANVVEMTDDNMVLTKQNITETSIEVAEDFLKPNRPFFWRVRAYKSGSAAEWSDIWKFVTAKDASTVPTAVFPVDSARNVPLSITFEWTEIESAESYNFQVYDRPSISPANLVFDETGLTENSFKVPTDNLLEDDVAYYWHIQAVDNDIQGDLPWSYLYIFTTGDEFPTNGIFEFKQSAITTECFPNPANSELTLTLDIPEANSVSIDIFDINGNVIGKIAPGFVSNGSYSYVYNVAELPVGTYFYRVSANDGFVWNKFSVIK
jgi:uncharacterized protein YkwD